MPATFSFALATVPAPSFTPPAAAPAPVVLGQASTAKKAGLAWPFRVTASGNPATVTGDALRETRIAFVMATRASSTSGAGEIPMRMRVGSQAHLLLNTSFNEVRESMAAVYGQRAVGTIFPGEVVVAAEVESSDDGTVNVTLSVVDTATLTQRGIQGTLRRVPFLVRRGRR
jgi:hypothetical protein